MPKRPPGAGLKAIIAGAGGAAHLPGMLAAKTTVPVLGVPVASRHLQGVDSLHSIVQMPKGIPVATFAIGAAGAANAALFAVAMLATRTPACAAKLEAFRARQTEAARAMTAAAAGPPHEREGRCCPGATLGVMGGGQLGRMFVHAAQRMGYFTAVLDPDADSPAGRVSHHHVQRRLPRRDRPGQALRPLRRPITTEFENVPADALARAGRAPRRGARRRRGGDRAGPRAEKAHFARCGVPCAPYAVIDERGRTGGAWPTTCCPAS